MRSKSLGGGCKGIDTFQMRASAYPFAPGIWIIWGLLFCFIFPGVALADNIRPLYLEIEELQSGNIRVVWKVPRGQGIPPNLKPSFPEHFRVLSRWAKAEGRFLVDAEQHYGWPSHMTLGVLLCEHWKLPPAAPHSS